MKTRLVGIFLSVLLIPLSARAEDVNLLKNPSFEEVDSTRGTQAVEWYPFSESGESSYYTTQAEGAKSGARCVRLAFEKKKEKFLGITQRFAVTGGKTYDYTAFIKNVSLRDDSFCQLSIEWVGPESKELTRAWGPVAKATDISTDEWRKFELTAAAPEGAVQALAVVTVFPETTGDGTILVDDAKLLAR